MIEDKSLGLKVAENKDEAFFLELKESTLKEIERQEKLLKFNKEILWLCNLRLAKFKRTPKK